MLLLGFEEHRAVSEVRKVVVMELPTMAQLRGLPYEYAECYGKPHIGAHYEGAKMGGNRLNDGARCAVCMRPATNSHHQPPRSKGVFLFQGSNGLVMSLRPALVALCGMGNVSGCHGRAHHHDLCITWEWDSDEARQAWWSGELLTRYEPHSPELYRYGCWCFEQDGKAVRYRG